MNNTLTTDQAYTAMISFLFNYYSQTKVESILTLVGDLSVVDMKKPVDIVLWNSWLENVAKAKSGEVDAYMVLNGVPQRPPSA